MFNVLDELTEQLLISFIEGKRDWLTVSPEDFDFVNEVLEEKNIKTYSSIDAGDVVIERIKNNLNMKEIKNNMANVKAMRTGTKVTTGKVRLSYAHLFEAHAIEGNDPKFSVSVIIPKSDKVTLQAIKDAVEEAKELGKSKLVAKKGGQIPANIKTPLRDGDEERPDDDAYANCYFLNASSKNKPGVVDQDVQPVLDATEVYSGCYGRLTINFYAFSASGNKGIAAGLGNVQKLAEGEPLGGFTSAASDFDSVETATDDFLG